MRLGLALLALTLAGCSPPKHTNGRPFDPVQFFTGHTRGEATLRTLAGTTAHVSVTSLGKPDGRGGLLLVQRIAEQGKAARIRRWLIRPDGTNHWSGALTDAEGPAIVARSPTEVTIRYQTRSGQRFQQQLQMSPDGVVENHLSVWKWGIRLATLDERIAKLD